MNSELIEKYYPSEKKGKENQILLEKIGFLEKEIEELIVDKTSKEVFISIIAHDLKSPFQGLLGINDLLLSSLDQLDKEEIKEYIKYMRTSIDSIYSLVDKLLQWSRVLINQMPFNITKCNLYEEMNGAILLYNTALRIKEITILNNIDINSYCYSDENMLNTIFRNLISNAIKFSPKVSAIETGSIKTDSAIIVWVKDYGVGISNENKEKLFRLDQHFSMTGTNDETGSGLGLLLCQELLKKNSGKIWFETELGSGSIFYVSLPSSLDELADERD
ncbi:MAG: HAMP domain-containing histidine kinase [Melioribacteraceae bacterium]|nr:HAMP domain-containing histidine kinase [Melioribacteraceae bacterium]